METSTLDVGVQENHTDAPPSSPACAGSPISLVALALLLEIVAPAGAMTVGNPNESFWRRRCRDGPDAKGCGSDRREDDHARPAPSLSRATDHERPLPRSCCQPATRIYPGRTDRSKRIRAQHSVDGELGPVERRRILVRGGALSGESTVAHASSCPRESASGVSLSRLSRAEDRERRRPARRCCPTR